MSDGNFPTTGALPSSDSTGTTTWIAKDPYVDLAPFASTSAPPTVTAGAGPSGANAAVLTWQQPNESTGIYLRRLHTAYEAGLTYALTFDVKLTNTGNLKGNTTVTGGISGASFLSGTFTAETTWKTFTHVFTASTTTANGEINFYVGALPSGSVAIANVSLKKNCVVSLPAGETLHATLDNISVPRRVDFHKRTRAMQTDWFRFMWQLESSYWSGMRTHLNGLVSANDRPLFIGTVVENSPCYIQAESWDVVDTHAYWNHYGALPSGLLVAPNYPMSGTKDRADTITRANSRRILNKPFISTEYGHGFPGTYGTEAAPAIGAYGAMHNWQAVCFFAYEDHNREEVCSDYLGQPINGTGITSGGRYDSGFEGVWTMGRAPAKMATVPFAVTALKSIPVVPATAAARVITTQATAIEVMRQKLKVAIGAGDFGAGADAIDIRSAFTLSLGTQLDTNDCYLMRPSLTPVEGNLTAPSGELRWSTTTTSPLNNARCMVITNAKAKAFYGYYTPGSAIDLGDNVSVALQASAQRRIDSNANSESWGGVALVLKEGTAFGASGSRWLVAMGGYTDNFEQIWTPFRGPLGQQNSPAVSSAVRGGNGNYPSMVERIAGTLSFPVGSSRLAAYGLDENGDRISPLAVTYNSGVATVTIPATTPTLWYEMSVDAPSTGFTLAFPQSSNGYGGLNATAIGMADTALAANSNLRSTDDAVWTKLGTGTDAENMAMSAQNSSFTGASGHAIVMSDGDAGMRGGTIDLRGQNIPSDRAWEVEAALKFSSGTYGTPDDVNLIIGQDIDHPVVDIALARPANSGSAFGVQLLTSGGLVTLRQGQLANDTWVKVRVRVTPPGAAGAPAAGKLELWINGSSTAETLSTDGLPSPGALPDELFLFTGAAATGNAWVDEIKVTIL